MSLIASFYFIKSPIFAVFINYFSMFISSSVFDLSVYICNPNGKTAEPEYYRRVAKAKEKMGGKSFSGC